MPCQSALGGRRGTWGHPALASRTVASSLELSSGIQKILLISRCDIDQLLPCKRQKGLCYSPYAASAGFKNQSRYPVGLLLQFHASTCYFRQGSTSAGTAAVKQLIRGPIPFAGCSDTSMPASQQLLGCTKMVIDGSAEELRLLLTAAVHLAVGLSLGLLPRSQALMQTRKTWTLFAQSNGHCMFTIPVYGTYVSWCWQKIISVTVECGCQRICMRCLWPWLELNGPWHGPEARCTTDVVEPLA